VGRVILEADIVQASGGERSAPSQVYRAGISPPAAKAGEVRVRLTGGLLARQRS